MQLRGWPAEHYLMNAMRKHYTRYVPHALLPRQICHVEMQTALAAQSCMAAGRRVTGAEAAAAAAALSHMPVAARHCRCGGAAGKTT